MIRAHVWLLGLRRSTRRLLERLHLVRPQPTVLLRVDVDCSRAARELGDVAERLRRFGG